MNIFLHRPWTGTGDTGQAHSGKVRRRTAGNIKVMESRQSKISFASLCLCAFVPFLRYFICAIACVALLTEGHVSAEELNVKAAATRSQIYIGESFILEVTVSGSSGPADIDLSKLKNANIRELGSRNISNYQITIINGQMTREGFTGFVSSYEITPLAAGQFQAGPVEVSVAGKTIAAEGPSITVTDIEKQDRVIIAVNASRETALIDEPFQITLNLKIKAMGGEAASYEPLFPDNPPALTIPWLEQEMKGLAGPDIRQLLTGLLAPHWNQPGVTINKFSLAPDPFDIGSMFSSEPRRAKFAIPHKKTIINGVSYYEYDLKFDYISKDEGNYVFGPVVFKGQVPERIDEHGKAVGPMIFAVGPARTVRVIPPPEKDRPLSYSGAIGSNMTVKASLDATSCNVGDPLKLTLTVAGQVKLDKILPPKLSLQTNLLERFTIYDNTVQTVKKDFFNQYIYTIRPNQPGAYQIPPIEMSYYDVAGRSYKKIFTVPINLVVKRGVEVTEAQLIGNTNKMAAKAEEKDIRNESPSPIRTDSSGAAPGKIFGGYRTVVAAGAGPLLYLAVVLVGFLRRSARRTRLRFRKHSAKSRAVCSLRAAARLKQENSAQAAGLICEALRKYLAERLCCDTAALTPAETERLLENNRVSGESARDFGALYEKYFNAGFAGAQVSADMPDDCRKLAELISRIENEIEKKH